MLDSIPTISRQLSASKAHYIAIGGKWSLNLLKKMTWKQVGDPTFDSHKSQLIHLNFVWKREQLFSTYHVLQANEYRKQCSNEYGSPVISNKLQGVQFIIPLFLLLNRHMKTGSYELMKCYNYNTVKNSGRAINGPKKESTFNKRIYK